MMTELVVHQYTNALDSELIETHIFPDADAFQAWLDSQETTVFLEFQPRDEVLNTRVKTILWDRLHDRPADVFTPPEDTYPRTIVP